MKKNDANRYRPKKYNPFSDENIGLEALAAEAKKRGTSYGKLCSHLSEEEKRQIIQAYREAHNGKC